MISMKKKENNIFLKTFSVSHIISCKQQTIVCFCNVFCHINCAPLLAFPVLKCKLVTSLNMHVVKDSILGLHQYQRQCH